MKIYKINECDYYMANSLLEAIECAMKDTGLNEDEIYDPDLACELEDYDLDNLEYSEELDDGVIAHRTFREELESRNQVAQLFASSEY